jgi:hypothetical protein
LFALFFHIVSENIAVRNQISRKFLAGMRILSKGAKHDKYPRQGKVPGALDK